ncbi:MAG: protein kinase domain-containing protein [Solirubrobacteraceae bacterium]
MQTTAPHVPAPAVLGRYRLRRRLGAGGFGTVWLAHDERLDREVAVKIVPRERVVGGRFEREARAAARLTHPGIVTLYEAGADDEGAYLVSELVRGQTLAELLHAGRLSDRDVVAIGIALCDALSHAHAQGVTHRDVKPSNVLVPDQPSTAAQVAKLTDFGVARVLGGDSLTYTGDVLGTAAYMAPEQAEGLEAGAPADLYSLALVLYEALTGVNPVRTGTAAQRARRLGAYLPPLRRQRRDLPRALGQGIDLALRPRARERGDIGHLRAALEASLPAVADEPGAVTGAWRAPPERDERDDAPGRFDAPVPFAAPDPPSAEPASAPDAEGPAHAPVPLPARVVAAVGSAALAAWLVGHIFHPAPVAPASAALVAGIVVGAFPRVGWMVLSLAAVAGLTLQHQAGSALVLALAALVPVLMLPVSGWAWSTPALAPGLGALGLAGAWPALAARLGNPWRRAALGATGWLWVLIAEALTGSRLYLGPAPGTLPPAVWAESPQRAIHDALVPMLSGAVLAPALVWAAAAVVRPWLVRGRSPALDVVRTVVWSATLVSATGAVTTLTAGTSKHGTPRGAVLGALAAVAIALVPTAVGMRRARPQPRAAQPRFP